MTENPGTYGGASRYWRILALMTLAFWCGGCAKAPSPRSESILGTICTVNLYERGTEKTYEAIFSRFREIEQWMSVNLPGTELEELNKNAGIKPVKAHPETLDVLEAALEYAEKSGGAFDPTIGPLVKLWGIGFDNARLPSAAEIQGALSLVNWRDLELNREEGFAYLLRPGMAVDLGAIAKGYAADEAARILDKTNIPRALIDLGGNVYAYGEKEGNTPWRIGVQNPLENRGAFLGVLELRNKSVVTSGVYERYLEADGVKYHHILSTSDGYPARNGLLSVTIVADRSIDGDALSTSVFALGYEKGRALTESVPGAFGIFVFEDLTVRLSEGASQYFSLTDPAFTLIEP